MLTSGLALAIFAMIVASLGVAADGQDPNLVELCRQHGNFKEVDQGELAAYT